MSVRHFLSQCALKRRIPTRLIYFSISPQSLRFSFVETDLFFNAKATYRQDL